MHGFLLGLANGATCLAYCAPILVPYLLGEGKNIRQNSFILGQFLLGRLLGYLIFAVAARFISPYITMLPVSREILMGLVYMILAVVLYVYSRKDFQGPSCAARSFTGITSGVMDKYPAMMPILMGSLTGLNLCPPFLLVFADALGTQSMVESMLYFFMFFLGTTIYFLPTPFIGALKKFPPLRSIGKMVAILMAGYYFYIGLIMMIGGIKIA